MHELSVCQALLAQVAQLLQARGGAEGARQVERITIEIGPLAGVEPALLARAFGFARLGTAAAQADLVIETVEVTVRCLVCGQQSAAQVNRLLCAACGGFRVRLVTGDELRLRSVELRPDAPSAATAAAGPFERHGRSTNV
jgi:hydrogenase nickel incorporation protein HypA/HybF